MDYLRTASFGGLFTAAFVVGATFQVVLTLLGVVMALLAPGVFQMNGAPAAGPVQALGALLFLLVFGLAMNTLVSAAGAGLWVLLRRWLPAAGADRKA